MPQWDLTRWYLDWHTGLQQGPLQTRDVGHAGTHQHGHLRPIDGLRLIESGSSQQVGDGCRLLLITARRQQFHLPRGTFAHRIAVLPPLLPGEGAQRDWSDPSFCNSTNLRTETSGAVKDHDRGGFACGSGELVGEIEDAAHIGTPKAVDRLVRITHRHQGGIRCRQGLDESHLRRVGVLVLIDVDGLEPRSDARVPFGKEPSTVDRFAVVHCATQIEQLQVVLEELRYRRPFPRRRRLLDDGTCGIREFRSSGDISGIPTMCPC